jgi:dUTP pyrophosphatase
MKDFYILNKSDNPTPKYETQGSAGFDIRANDNYFIEPGETILIGTGLHFIVPENHEAQIRIRSSIALEGLCITNSPGTIDCDYRGEVKVIMHNLSKCTIVVEGGMRIAQVVLNKLPHPNLRNIRDISEGGYRLLTTDRGAGGFGSTGKN